MIGFLDIAWIYFSWLLPVILLPVILVLHYIVFKKQNKTLVFPALLFLFCGILLADGIHWIGSEVSPYDFEQRYTRAIKNIKAILPELKNDSQNDELFWRVGREIQYLRFDTENKFMDTTRFEKVIDLFLNEKYEEALAEMDATSKTYLITSRYHQRKKPLWKKIREPFYIFGMVYVLFILFTLGMVTLKQRREGAE